MTLKYILLIFVRCVCVCVCVGIEYIHTRRYMCVCVQRCMYTYMHVHWRPEADLSVHLGALSFFFEMDSVIALEVTN